MDRMSEPGPMFRGGAATLETASGVACGRFR